MAAYDLVVWVGGLQQMGRLPEEHQSASLFSDRVFTLHEGRSRDLAAEEYGCSHVFTGDRWISQIPEKCCIFIAEYGSGLRLAPITLGETFQADGTDSRDEKNQACARLRHRWSSRRFLSLEWIWVEIMRKEMRRMLPRAGEEVSGFVMLISKSNVFSYDSTVYCADNEMNLEMNLTGGIPEAARLNTRPR